MDDFERELKIGFLDEAAQLLTEAEQCFLELEADPRPGETLDKIFRVAHNVKGSSKAVGFEQMGAFTHEFESFLLKLKNASLPITSETISLLLRCNDHLKTMVEGLKLDLNQQFDSTALITQIELASQGRVEEKSAEKNEPDPSDMREIELLAVNSLAHDLPNSIPDEKLFEELESETAHSISQIQVLSPVKAQVSSKAPPSSEESIRVSLQRLEKLINSVGELVILQTVLKEQSYGSNPVLLHKTIHQIGKVTKEVQDISMSLRMVPLKQTFQKMQRIVRDTSASLGKKVHLTMIGEETELDKTVLENIGDPLVHLIRNACDHGIESPEKRLAAGKPETGNVSLAAYHQSGKLVIEVKDDGGGIAGDRLVQKAIEKGILPAGTTMNEQESIRLIFHPGFSTKAEVTDVSGRGVGMDVVKTNIESLQGEVQVHTVIGEGSTFKVILPLTLAIIDGMVIRNDDERFVIPLSHIHETLRPSANDIHTVTGMGEMLHLRGETIPMYRLTTLLGKKEKTPKLPHDHIVLVIRTEEQPFGIMVDDILNQQQVVIKEVGKEIQNLKWMTGSAILGDGKPSVILEVSELIHSRSGKAGLARLA